MKCKQKNWKYHWITGCRIICLCIMKNTFCHINISWLININMTNSICIVKIAPLTEALFCKLKISHFTPLTSMTKNRNFRRTLDFRNKHITASGNHKIYHIIKLWQYKKSLKTNCLQEPSKVSDVSTHLEQIRNLLSWNHKSNKFVTNSIWDGWTNDL